MVIKSLVNSVLTALGFGSSGTSAGWVPLVIGLGALLLLPVSVAGGSPDPPAQGGLPWSSLTLQASKFGLKALSSLTVESQPAAARRELIEVPDKEVIEPGSGALLLTEETSFAGRKSQTRIWFDGGSGSTQQREVLETGKRERKKINRFTREGVLSYRLNPTREERGRPPSAWTDNSETFYPFNGVEKGIVRQVIEPGALVYLVAAGELRRPGQRQILHVFASKEVLSVEATAQKMTTADVDFQLTEGGQVRRVDESHYPALAVTLRPGPGENDASDMKILGLEGDVTLLIDPQRRLPLEVSGRVKYVGRVTIRLQEAVVD